MDFLSRTNFICDCLSQSTTKIKNTFSCCFLLGPIGSLCKYTYYYCHSLFQPSLQFLLSPAANSWESRMPDSCRDLMQESTSSSPVVSSSSMSFCPSTHKGRGHEKGITLVLVLGLNNNKMQKRPKKPALDLMQFNFSSTELQEREEKKQPRLSQRNICQQSQTFFPLISDFAAYDILRDQIGQYFIFTHWPHES